MHGDYMLSPRMQKCEDLRDGDVRLSGCQLVKTNEQRDELKFVVIRYVAAPNPHFKVTIVVNVK